tara:strand:+ start:867 stop:1889 length:1023 start_codon:yes stop_codon:yes gene_type:complete
MKEQHVKEQPIQGMMGMGGGATGYLSGGSAALQEYTQTFNYTGSVQDFAIPSGTTQITAYIFGAGGGAEGDTVSYGGAGGFTVGTINASYGGTLKVVVGGAGGPGTQNNGSGGGMSGVFTSAYAQSNASTDQDAAILIAGAGGGGADATDANNGNAKAGAGGGLIGQKGYVGTGGGDSGGNGGTQSAGGAYPGSGGGSCTATSCAGAKLRGGTACGGAEGSGGVGWPNQVYGGTWGSAAGGNGCNAGGGGGGYWGGSGGGGDPNGGCGGGGSSYIGGHSNYAVSNATAYQGNYNVPNSNATSSAYYSSGISQGGVYNSNAGGNGNHTGGHGKIVFVYLAP